ncbi:GGDEF domain-containing protein [Acinetobacter sp. MD2(2019)]|uniref:sensor domain-containing diguanylate cyclase n=1 Tax=Acinetobacter sp. MD2(2019) TaxID=2605273 RepID=UPI002D1E5CD3|nr:GGDEF domain-containing protein [Acinetobacter sp. MD2(2019)]MEB3753775.1 GGDEF domain-containing protein [Acinetobacter sp. MD2(2019)]
MFLIKTTLLKSFLKICLVALVVFLLASISILSRPLNFFASIWLPNAFFISYFIFIGNIKKIIILFPGLFVGFFFADWILTSESPLLILHLTITNLISIYISSILSIDEIPCFYIILMFGAMLCSGYAFIFAQPFMVEDFQNKDILFYLYWFTGECLNYSIFIIFFYSIISAIHKKQFEYKIENLKPLVLLTFSTIVAIKFTGIASIAFILPAIIWCALSYPMTILSLLIVISFGTQYYYGLVFLEKIPNLSKFPFELDQRVSLQIGTTLATLVPIIINILVKNQRYLIKKFKLSSQKDYLTNIFNRRGFLELINKEDKIEKCALLIIDIDFFKKINDTYGHDIGDNIIRHTCKIISDTLPENTFFCRYGGEEFMILYRNTTKKDTMQLAENIRTNIEKNPYIISNKKPLSITVSIGLSYLEYFKTKEYVDFFNKSDQALYIAKNNGRNRTFFK